MGWASGNEVFELVADALVEAGASDDVKQAVCSALIGALRIRGWDTAAESMGLYADDKAIRAAFREHGIVETCYEEHLTEVWVCEETEGHKGDHRDCNGHNWPQ
jgi:hypothetical protein